MLQQLGTIVAGASAVRALGTLLFVSIIYLRAMTDGKALHAYLSEWMFNVGLFNSVQVSGIVVE
jgi:hypothetical protein